MVEWKKLGDLCEIGTGSNNREDACENGSYPFFVRSKEVLRINTYLFDEEAILIPGEGGVGEIFHYIKGKYGLHQRTYRVHPKSNDVIGKFIYYYLFENFGQYINRKSFKSTATSIRKPMLIDFLIPIPSLDEQKRIVGILDTFTDSIENLKQQIAQRRKQYTYLIDNAFGGSLSEMKKKAEDGVLRIEPLSAHGTFTRGRRFVRTDVVEEGQPCIHYGDMYTFYGLSADKANTHLPYDFPKKMRYAKKGDVVIVGAGENNEDIAVGLVWLGDEPAAVHDACYIYENDFEPMFLSYFLRSSIYHLQIKSHVVRGKICSISSDGIGKALIPVYTMEKQKEIVSKLLPFESLLNNLEAQLALRQKQYEYYRNQLLTFE
jgi:type I restriction enzyme S subunit